MADSSCDIAIVGAGAAGLAAARTLAGTTATTVLLEARSRIGGRVTTAAPWRDLPIDLGAEWLHSADRNVLAGMIAPLGLAIDRTPPHWMRQTGARNFPEADQAAFRAARDAFEDRVAQAGERGEEAAGSTCYEPGNPWNPLLDAVSSYYNGAELDLLSIQDYAAYVDTGINWRVKDGYGTALAALAAGASAVLDCPVSRIDHSGSLIRLSTPQGEITARAVIVAVPTPHIAEGRLVFTPDLPVKREAAAGLPLGLADKVFVALHDPEALPVEGHFFGHPDRTATGSYHTRPMGRPLIEGYFGGRCAAGLERAGEGALAAFAMDELAALFGSDFRAKSEVITTTRWLGDRWALGSYSHALPGHAGDRRVLAETVDERLFFAGEACSAHFYSTAHGAWETGEMAALRALAALG